MINKIKIYFLREKAIMYSILGTCWKILFAPISLYLISLKLTPELQGYYYLFFSIAGIQQIAEVGFSHTLIQGISHEMSKVNFTQKEFIGESSSIKEIEETMRLGFSWYSLLTIISISIVYPIGISIMSDGTDIMNSSWFIPWSFFILFSALNLFFYPVNFFLEGIQELEKIYKIRLFIQVISGFIFTLLLVIDLNLLSIIAVPVSSLIANYLLLYRPYRNLFHQYMFKLPSKYFINKILGWQLKVGFVWSSSYLYWQFPTIIIFSILGPSISGQYSMSSNIINSIMGIGQVFIKTKSSIIGCLRANGDKLKALSIYKNNANLSYLIVTFLFIVFFTLWILFPHFSIFKRLLPISECAILTFSFGINMITINQAMYTRCSKKEPFFYLSLFVNIIFPLILYCLLLIYSNIIMVIFAFVSIHIIELIWGNSIFNKVLKEN